MTTFREWATIVFGPEHGGAMADDMAEAVGRELDAAVFYGTTTQSIQENEMDQQQITEVSATVDAGLSQDDLDGMSEAERLALVVGSAYGAALHERDEARAQVMTLGGLLDRAVSLLRQAKPRLEDSTWASDSSVAGSIQAFLEDVDSGQTPTQED